MVLSSESDGYRVSPVAAASWWAGLSEVEKRRERQRCSRLVGRQDGLPVRERDEVNRSRLDTEMRRALRRDSWWGRVMTWLGRVFNRNFTARSGYQALRYLHERVNQPSPSGHRYYLVDFQPIGDGEVVVAQGNPDTAANVVVYVPGSTAMLADTSSRGPDDDFHRCDVLATDAARASDDDTSVVFWLGYDAPNNPAWDAGFETYALASADALSGFTHGLRASREAAEPARVTLLGHSYGSTVVGVTARDRGLSADALIFIGSPGLGEGVDTVADLGVDEVWASQSDDDIISAVDGWHGVSPVAEEFGARVFHSAAQGHDGYWYEGNQAGRDTMARVITGKV